MSDIHQRIRHIREDRNLTREAFGTAIGASAAKVQALENGRQRVDHITLEALSRNFGVDANWLLSGEDNHHFPDASVKNTVSDAETYTSDPDFIPVPRLDVAASAGHGSLVESEEGSGTYAFNRKWLARRGLNPKQLSVISVTGDSMEPDLHDGDLILINQADTTLRDGRMYAVRFSKGLFVKQVQFFPGQRIFLQSRNNRYASIIIDQDDGEDVQIIGRVVASMHEW